VGAKLGGGGGGRYTVEQNADINVTPFVDVMLVLLIIFMVAAPLATVSIRLDFPPAVPPKDAAKPKEPTVISIQQDGSVYISGPATPGASKQTSAATLDADIKEVTGMSDPRGEMIFIRANEEVLYGMFMETMNTLQEDGYFKIGLIPEDMT
jgi:biopolymer transport protein ExbD